MATADELAGRAVLAPVEDVRATVLRSGSDLADLDASAETLLVEVVDAEGRIGIGEADTASRAGQALVQMEGVHRWNAGLRDTLLGADPVQVQALWHRMVERTRYVGPSGVARHAIAAVDMALHDLAGKQLGRPAHHLLGGARQERVTPYATVYAGAVRDRTLAELMQDTTQRLLCALEQGFRAVKMEVIFEEAASDAQLVDCIREGRRVVGDDVPLLVDFGYRWTSWRDALWVLRRVEACGLWLAEAVLPHDDLEGHARLAPRIEPRLGGAEMASTLEECRAWIELGGVDVLQPDIARAGGLTELRRIAELAALHGVEVVPHNWKTGIDAAAARHLQVASGNVPLIEMFTPELFESPLRRDLVRPEPVVIDGHVALPDAPGLGVELVPETVAAYAVGALAPS